MGVSITFGNSAARAAGEQHALEAEDRLMELDEIETKDLAFHVEKEAQRTKVIIMRMRQLNLMIVERTDRNMWATIIIGAVLLMKGVVTPTDIGNFFAWLFQHI